MLVYSPLARVDLPKNGGKLVGALEVLDAATHASASQGTTAKDLAGIVSDMVGHAGGLELEQRDGAGQFNGLFQVRHVAHLVGNVLQPVLDRLQGRDLHVSNG